MYQHGKKVIAVLLALAIILFLFSACVPSTEINTPTVRIAIPYEEQLFGINEEYYKEWLEKETKLNIEFQFIPQSYTNEYLRMLFSGQDSGIDAVFFSKGSALSPEELAAYGTKGTIAQLDHLIDSQGVYLPKIFEQHSAYDLRQAMTATDEHIYYMPALTSSASTENFQTLWINVERLEKLGLTIPVTTEEFKQVLRAFAQYDPEGAPLIGSTELESTFACNFLMNSFTVCDPQKETPEELYEAALKEDTLVVYSTTTRIYKVKESFEAAYPGLTVEVYDTRAHDMVET